MVGPLILMTTDESRDESGELLTLLIRDVVIVGDTWVIESGDSFVGTKTDETSRLDFFQLDIDPLGD